MRTKATDARKDEAISTIKALEAKLGHRHVLTREGCFGKLLDHAMEGPASGVALMAIGWTMMSTNREMALKAKDTYISLLARNSRGEDPDSRGNSLERLERLAVDEIESNAYSRSLREFSNPDMVHPEAMDLVKEARLRLASVLADRLGSSEENALDALLKLLDFSDGRMKDEASAEAARQLGAARLKGHVRVQRLATVYHFAKQMDNPDDKTREYALDRIIEFASSEEHDDASRHAMTALGLQGDVGRHEDTKRKAGEAYWDILLADNPLF